MKKTSHKKGCLIEIKCDYDYARIVESKSHMACMAFKNESILNAGVYMTEDFTVGVYGANPGLTALNAYWDMNERAISNALNDAGENIEKVANVMTSIISRCIASMFMKNQTK